MSTLQAEFEALMPEPVGRIYSYVRHTPRVEWFRRPGDAGTPLYTADQMRAMFDAATERAAKEEREAILTICAELREHYSDFKDTALLNGDVDLSNAASGEPRACDAIAAAIRARDAASIGRSSDRGNGE